MQNLFASDVGQVQIEKNDCRVLFPRQLEAQAAMQGCYDLNVRAVRYLDGS